MPTFFDGLNLIVILSFLAGIGKFAYDAAREGTRRRSDLYEKLREKFDSDEFSAIKVAIDSYTYGSSEEKRIAEEAIHDTPLPIKEKYAGLIEYIGLVTKSGIISYRLANYEFGYYAILCWECSPFWDDITDPDAKQNDPYWALYRDFVEKLRPAASALKNNLRTEIGKLKI